MTEKEFYAEWTEAIEEFMEMYHNRPLGASNSFYGTDAIHYVKEWTSDEAYEASDVTPEAPVVADSVVPDTLKEMVEE